MFKLREFIMKTLDGMFGNYPEFQVREFALNWFSRGVLLEEDLAAIEVWYTPIVEELPEDLEGIEELPQETNTEV